MTSVIIITLSILVVYGAMVLVVLSSRIKSLGYLVSKYEEELKRAECEAMALTTEIQSLHVESDRIAEAWLRIHREPSHTVAVEVASDGASLEDAARRVG